FLGLPGGERSRSFARRSSFRDGCTWNSCARRNEFSAAKKSRGAAFNPMGVRDLGFCHVVQLVDHRPHVTTDGASCCYRDHRAVQAPSKARLAKVFSSFSSRYIIDFDCGGGLSSGQLRTRGRAPLSTAFWYRSKECLLPRALGFSVLHGAVGREAV